MARVEQKLEDQGHSLERIENTLTNFVISADNKYVSQDSFRPIQRLVYSLAGAVLISVVTAILALIIQHKWNSLLAQNKE